MTGITGTLLSRTFLERRLTAWPGLELATRGHVRARLDAWWRHTHATCGPATSLRALADRAGAGLANVFGLTVTGWAAVGDELWVGRFEHAGGGVPFGVVPWSAPLDAARRDLARAALAAASRYAVLTNGVSLRLADLGAAAPRRHLDFSLAIVADNELSSSTLAALIAALCIVLPGDGRELDRIVAAADADGLRLCAALRDGVIVALEELCQSLSCPSRRPPALAAAYEEALTAVYRLLFLSFAEARRLVPSWHPIYRDAYTIAALCAQAERPGASAGLWAAFQAMSRLAHEGCEAGDLHVAAFNGSLFAPSGAPRLESGRLDDERLRAAIVALSSAPAAGGFRERISYGDLGVEELGGIYESLLDYEPAGAAASGPSRETVPRVVLRRTGRHRRKETGTFYTPVPLTRYLVRQALGPLVAGVPAEAVLRTRVVDPSMGSGAFLVAACHFLAETYEAALVRDGTCAAGDISDADRAGFRRTVAQRCLYGVDLNPTAVQLGRLSLWLTTLAADRPLGFLDHRLRCGDSLLGATLNDLSRGVASPSRRRVARDQLPLFPHASWHESRRSAVQVRCALERDPDDTASDVWRKEAAFAALTAADVRWTWLADLWCSARGGDTTLRGPEFNALLRHLVDGGGPLPAGVASRALADARSSAADARYLHWPLAFPEVFCDEDGRENPEGGFDAVIGNPPWEMLRADERQPARTRAVRTLRFTRDAGVYHHRSSGHPNEYQLFVERAIALARPGGRIGLVLPHGLACDQGAAPLRHQLFHQCTTDAIVGFENRRAVFPIHRSVRFLLLTSTRGGHTGEVRCRFGLQDPSTLDALAERPAHDALPVVITPALLERLSGPGLAIPDVRSPADLVLAEKLSASHPRLADPTGWGARFGRELNATDDARHFVARGPGLPVLDGRHLSPFRIDLGAATRWLPRDLACSLLDERRTFGRARLAFRDVASATNRTTLISAVVPAGCVTTHTIFCLRTPLTAVEQWILCALLNSYVANFLVRLRVSSHVSLAIMETLPVPRMHQYSVLGRSIAACARLVARGGPGGRDAEASAQALAAVAYGIDDDEFERVLEAFPLVEMDVRARAREALRRARQRPGCR